MTEFIVRTIFRIGQTRFSKWLFYGLVMISYVLFMLPPSGISAPVVNDKLLHGAIFFTLAVSANLAFLNQSRTHLFILLACYGLFTEISQGFVSYREFSILDWTADVIGLICGLFAIRILCHYYPHLLQKPSA